MALVAAALALSATGPAGLHAAPLAAAAPAFGPGVPPLLAPTDLQVDSLPGALGGVSVMGATLPEYMCCSPVGEVGGKLYVLGGYGYSTGPRSQILEYDPASDTLVVKGATLPGSRIYASTFSDGQAIYIIGGINYATLTVTNEILKYDPAADAVTVVGALPTPRYLGAAAFDGQNAYFIGGLGGPFLGEIVRFDPATGAVQTMGAMIPPRYYHQAFSDGSRVFVFGGFQPYGPDLYPTDILAYDPVMDAVSAQGAVLPWGVWEGLAGAAGPVGFHFGGAAFTPPYNTAREILRYDPATDALRTLVSQLPNYYINLGDPGWDPVREDMFLFGGCCGGPGFYYNTIIRYDPNPTALVAPVAPLECTSGLGGESVTLDGTGSTHPEGDPLSFQWSAAGVTFDDAALAMPTGFFPVGTTPVTLAISDGYFGASAATDVVITDTVPPAVALMRPTAGSTYVNDAEQPLPPLGPTLGIGPLTVEAVAEDDCGIARVEFTATSVNPLGSWTMDGSDDTPPYEFTLNPPVESSGEVTVTATAIDFGGNEAWDSVTFLQGGTTLPA